MLNRTNRGSAYDSDTPDVSSTSVRVLALLHYSTSAIANPTNSQHPHSTTIATRKMIGHGGGGGGGAGGADSNLNSRVMTVLAQMGLTGATQLPDGSIRLPDGRIVGEFGMEKDENGGGDGIEGSRGVEGRGASVSGVMKGVPASVQAVVQGLEAEVHASKKKLQVWHNGKPENMAGEHRHGVSKACLDCLFAESRH